jgi:hypothetical protein
MRLAPAASVLRQQLDVDRVEPSDYPAFRRFIEQADEVLRQRIAFARESR